ncbi:MAG: autotransporter-associated beta strand repeat-containing protein [Phycisphaerae bacterium]
MILFRKSDKRAILTLAAASTFVVAAHANAAIDSWTGATSGSWSEPTNWLAGAVPQNGDDLLFSGGAATTTTSNDLASLSLANITFDATAPAYILNGPNAVDLTANITNASTNLQTLNLPITYEAPVALLGGFAGLSINGAIADNATTGAQTLSLGGNGTLTNNLAASAGGAVVLTTLNGANWTMLDSGSAVTLAKGQLNVLGGSTFNFGSLTSSPSLTITANSGSDHTVGEATAGTVGTFNVVGGTLVLKTRLNSLNGNINISGGATTVWNQIQIANGDLSQVSNFTMSGGTLNILSSSGGSSGGTFFVASRGIGTLNMNGGTMTIATLDVSRGAQAAVAGGAASQGVVNLNGGTLVCTTVSTATSATANNGTGATATLNFNGGTLKARSNQSSFIKQSNASGSNIPLNLFVQAGGAVIDSNTFNIGTSRPLQHDPALGATLDGGLTKKSAGALTLSGDNTYTGNTVIQGGSIALSSSTSTNNIPNSAAIIVGDTPANSAAGLTVTGITSGFHVVAGQTIAGYGTITGDAFIDGILAPGNAGAGTLTDTGNATLSAGAAMNLDLDAPDVAPGAGANDLFGVSAALTLNPNLTVNIAPGVDFAPGTYHLATFATDIDNSSTFSGWTVTGIDPSLHTSFALTTNTLDLVVTSSAVPEPASLGMLALGAVAMLKRRRK